MGFNRRKMEDERRLSAECILCSAGAALSN
jgi:hypothetical protein